MITIIDYDAGNLRNVQRAFERLSCYPVISNSIEDIKKADILILPGVGAFGDAMEILISSGLAGAIVKEVTEKQKPILGICLGMQVLGEDSTEKGMHKGLNLLPFNVKQLNIDTGILRLPHMGWNSIKPKNNASLFESIPEDADFYFVHSYYASCKDDSIVAAECNYSQTFTAAIQHRNIFATQFHPEKSQRFGSRVLSNFLNCCRNQFGIVL